MGILRSWAYTHAYLSFSSDTLIWSGNKRLYSLSKQRKKKENAEASIEYCIEPLQTFSAVFLSKMWCCTLPWQEVICSTRDVKELSELLFSLSFLLILHTFFLTFSFLLGCSFHCEHFMENTITPLFRSGIVLNFGMSLIDILLSTTIILYSLSKLWLLLVTKDKSVRTLKFLTSKTAFFWPEIVIFLKCRK